jgi:hypothetical protein
MQNDRQDSPDSDHASVSPVNQASQAIKANLNDDIAFKVKEPDQHQGKESPIHRVSQVFQKIKNPLNRQSKPAFNVYDLCRKVDEWVEDFVDEYFNQRHYTTYLMCYAVFLLVAIVFVFTQR